MTALVQPSLLDVATDADDAPSLRPLGGGLERTILGDGAWVDLQRDWMAGATGLYEKLEAEVPWRGERRPMYDRVVNVPRLVRFYGEGEELPDPVLAQARAALDEHYRSELGEGFRTVGLCYYRDGRDSVAWHGDRRGRGASDDTIVAIVSVGAPRRLLLRRRGGKSFRYELGGGDLFVMGGSCQRSHEHSVPKTARSVGGRVSIQFRPAGVG